MLDPTGLYWAAKGLATSLKQASRLLKVYNASDWEKFRMSVIHAKDNLEVVGSKKTKLLLTLLLVLLQHAQSSPPFGDSSPLPNLPESDSSRQIQITPGGLIRGGKKMTLPIFPVQGLTNYELFCMLYAWEFAVIFVDFLLLFVSVGSPVSLALILHRKL